MALHTEDSISSMNSKTQQIVRTQWEVTVKCGHSKGSEVTCLNVVGLKTTTCVFALAFHAHWQHAFLVKVRLHWAFLPHTWRCCELKEAGCHPPRLFSEVIGGEGDSVYTQIQSRIMVRHAHKSCRDCQQRMIHDTHK
jgi:hypothetical protein